MPEYNDSDIMKWFDAYHKAKGIVQKWKNANLVAGNTGIDYVKEVIASTMEIPENLRSEKFRKELSILVDAVKIIERKL